MKKAFKWVTVGFAAFFIATLIILLASRTAFAANSDDCTAGSGAWTPDGGSSDFGTCVYPPNSAIAISNCGPDNQYTFIFFSSEGTQDFCTFVAPSTFSAGSSGSGDPGGCRSEVRGPLEIPVTLAVCHGKNGFATFYMGDCELKCVITSALPSNAARKKPKHTVATIYIRTISPGGSSNSDPYTVCFNTKDLGLDPPTIYHFVGGSWVVVAVGNPNGSVVCGIGAGEGSYALSEPGKKE